MPFSLAIRQITPRGECPGLFSPSEFCAGEPGEFEAVVHSQGIPAVVERFEWSVDFPPPQPPDFRGGSVTITPLYGQQTTITVPPTAGSFVVSVEAGLSTRATERASATLVVLTPSQVRERLLACHFGAFVERVSRIPPYVILDRPGPDPAPLDRLLHDLRDASSRLDAVIGEVEQMLPAAKREHPAALAKKME